jgi:hypothetical protein
MPRVSEAVVPGFMWCPDGMCEGNSQQAVDVVRQTVEHTMLDSGGDSNQVEKGFDYIRFADGLDHECGVCGRQMECGEQERPVYPGSNWDPDGLKKLIRDGMTAAKGRDTSELDELRAQLKEMQEQMARQEPRRGPGRPPKQPQEA